MMRVLLITVDGHHVEVEAGGKYAPDVMHDQQGDARMSTASKLATLSRIIDRANLTGNAGVSLQLLATKLDVVFERLTGAAA